MICKLCGYEKKLIKAHIIPRSFYESLKEEGNVPIQYPINKNERCKQWQSGIYDKEILCKECDGNVLGPFDNYAQNLLLKTFKQKSDDEKFYIVNNIDYSKLKLFFISVLWRASITKNIYFSKVKLGIWENKLKDMILNKIPGEENEFSVIIAKYEGRFADVGLNPCRLKANEKNINYYRFRTASYVILIKVDRRPFPQELRDFILKENAPLLILVKDHESSTELKHILKVGARIPR